MAQDMNPERYIEIPEPVRDIYKLWRPTPFYRAYRLEQHLQTPAHIYYKYEGSSPVGSHKPRRRTSRWAGSEVAPLGARGESQASLVSGHLHRNQIEEAVFSHWNHPRRSGRCGSQPTSTRSGIGDSCG